MRSAIITTNLAMRSMYGKAIPRILSKIGPHFMQVKSRLMHVADVKRISYLYLRKVQRTQTWSIML